MPEYRRDPLTGRIVIIAEERAARPHQFDIEADDDGNVYRKNCPFCEGNESMTTGEVAAFRSGTSLPDSPGWSVRAIPNKYPAAVQNGNKFSDCRSFQNSFCPWGHHWGNHDFSPPVPIPGVGNHEVIVDTPRHVLSVSDMTDAEVRDMFRMYRQRLQSFQTDESCAYVQIFKNVGAAAGASIPHSHSQLIAMPFIPPPFLAMLYQAKDYRNEKKTQSNNNKSACFWCDMLESELRNRKRIVEETPNFVVLCPFVSRFSGEVEIYPKWHESHFGQCPGNIGDVLPEFTSLVRQTVIRLEKAVFWMKGKLAYNFVLNTQPFRLPDPIDDDLFHWHLSILPSLARAAGFEWGTGLHINPVSPESAAALLRGE